MMYPTSRTAKNTSFSRQASHVREHAPVQGIFDLTDQGGSGWPASILIEPRCGPWPFSTRRTDLEFPIPVERTIFNEAIFAVTIGKKGRWEC
jgi:hypothetical protein